MSMNLLLDSPRAFAPTTRTEGRRAPRAGPARPSFSIAVCTFKRTTMLAALLWDIERDLASLRRDIGGAEVEVLVVDNDPAGSARVVVESHAFARYLVEARPGIVAARNTAARAVGGAAVMWIDDDQRLAPGTLAAVWEAWRRRPHGVDAVRFAVRRWWHHLIPSAPAAGSFGYRPLGRGQVATNGLIVARSLLERPNPPFDARFDRRNGEDVDFFLRALERGARFMLLEEIALYEQVPRERDRIRYLFERGFASGWMDTWFDRRYPALGAVGTRPSTRPLRSLLRLLFAPIELLRHESHGLWGRTFRLGYLAGRLVGLKRGGMPPERLGASSGRSLSAQRAPDRGAR